MLFYIIHFPSYKNRTVSPTSLTDLVHKDEESDKKENLPGTNAKDVDASSNKMPSVTPEEMRMEEGRQEEEGNMFDPKRVDGDSNMGGAVHSGEEVGRDR